MPHLRLEVSDSLPRYIASGQLLLKLHSILHRVVGVRISNCKSRVIPIAQCVVGDGEGDQSFVHLDVSFLEGRSTSVRSDAGRELLQVLIGAYANCGAEPQITVEIRELPRQTYFKHPPGTLTPLE